MARQNDLGSWSDKNRLGKRDREMTQGSALQLQIRRISVLKYVVKQDNYYSKKLSSI